jgi:hypothetical protein
MKLVTPIVALSCLLLACGGSVEVADDAGSPPVLIHHDAGTDSGLVFSDASPNTDAQPPAMPTPTGTFLATFKSGWTAFVGRVSLPSGSVTKLFDITPVAAMSNETFGLAARPDGSLDLMETGMDSPTTWKTHIVQVDKTTGNALAPERVYDGWGTGGDYASDGTLWAGFGEIDTVDTTRHLQATDPQWSIIDVVWFGSDLYASGVCCGGGEDTIPQSTTLKFVNGTALDSSWVPPASGALARMGAYVIVAGGQQAVVYDPVSGGVSSPVALATTGIVEDATED